MLVRVLIVLLAAAVLLVILGLLLRLLEGKLLYHPVSLAGGELQDLLGPRDGPERFTEVEFDAEDGVRLTGWLGVPPEPRGYVLWCHGNAGNATHRFDDFEAFVTRCGFAVLLFDYRGYGRSDGKPDEEGLYRDARAARKYFLDTGADPARLFYLGRSLGGAVATALATESPPAGLILESTFTSAPDLGQEMFPVLPVRWVAKSEFGTLDRLADLDVPTLLFHGREDEIVPFAHGERLAAAGRRLRFVPLEGVGHNDVSASMGESYFDLVRRFVEDPAGTVGE